MTDKKKVAATSSRKGFTSIVSSSPKELKSFDELQKPNAYLNDWTDLATRSVKGESKK